MDSDAMEKRTPIEATYEEVTKYEVLDDASFSWVADAPGDAAALGEHTGNVVCVKETPAVIKTIDQTLVASEGGFESKVTWSSFLVPTVKRRISVLPVFFQNLPGCNTSVLNVIVYCYRT